MKTRRTYKHDLTGKRFGKLTALYDTGERKNGKPLWECRCDCGNITKVKSCNFVSGRTKSCGCYSREKVIEMNTTHGGTGTRLFRIWTSMKTRCSNPNYKKYEYYGGRGIKVCDEWLHDFAAFRKWALANGYKDNLTLDRKDPDGNYEPQNCQWATWHEQRINQRR